MSKSITYHRYCFPNGLRWAVLGLIPLAVYLMIMGWYKTSFLCLFTVITLWTFKYETSVNLTNRMINDRFYLWYIPFGTQYTFHSLNCLQITREQKGYRAASRSRDYTVNYTEYTLHLVYDQDKQLTLFVINDPDLFKKQVDKFAQALNLSVDTA